MVLTPEERKARLKKRKERAEASGTTKKKFPSFRRYDDDSETSGFTGNRYQIGDIELSKEEFRAAAGTLGFKGGGGEITPRAQEALAAQRESQISPLTKQIREDPSQFGLQLAGQEPEAVEGIETITEKPSIQEQLRAEAEELGATGITGFVGKQVNPALASAVEFLGGEFTMEDGDLKLTKKGFKKLTKNAVLTGLTAGLIGFKVAGAAGKILTNGKKIAQVGTAAKNTKAVAPIATRVRDFAIGGYAALKTGEGVLGYFAGRKIDEQQQAVNTLGQMATTIAGDSTEATGDWKKGLAELNYIKSEVLRLEAAIKAGTIASAQLKFSGKIYDINADMADQLATIDEQIRIINSFVITQSFPELTELEIQGILRELEEDGIIEAVDLTTSRRSTE